MEKKTGLIHVVPQWKCVDDQPENNRRLHYSRFALSPLLVDQAMTIGVAIRRALLSEVEGISIVSAKIVGAIHEYSTLKGVRESVDEILLNLKQIVLKVKEDTSRTAFPFVSCNEEEDYRASIFAQGPGIVTAEHIKFPSFILAVDKDQPIATLLNENQLCIELFIKRGSAKKLNHKKKTYTGFFLDATFPPVQKANFSIHSVGDPKGFQQLLLIEIWTNKTLTPAEALYQAHASLLNLFHQVSPPIPSNHFMTSVSYTSSISSLPKTKEESFERSGKEAEVNKVSLWNNSLVGKNKDSPTLVSDRSILDPAREVSRFLSLEAKKNCLETNNSNVFKDPLVSSIRLKSFTTKNLTIDKKIKDTLSQENFSIDELELSPRISNCLKRANIHTIAELSNYTEEDLLKLKNFGRKSVEEVNGVLRKRFNIELLPNK